MRRIKRLFALVLTALVLYACYSDKITEFVNMLTVAGFETPDTETGQIKCRFIQVVDGDTITVWYKGIQKVRLIGIDTPESVHADESKNTEYGAMASDYTKQLLENTKYVYLEFDEEMYDDYNRLLAYVYLDADTDDFTKSLNYRIVADGYAINKEYPPNTKHADELKNACEAARDSGDGLWSASGIEAVWSE